MFRLMAEGAPSAKSDSAVSDVVAPVWRVNWPLKV
jgi:hypothetical protein